MKTYAIILASGSSTRFGDKTPKQFLKINDQTILEKSIEAFELNERVTDIIVITNSNYLDLTKEILNNKFNKIKTIISGGETRQESSRIGVSHITENNAKVLIHDAARPFVSQEIISNCIKTLDIHTACSVAIPSTDTIIKVDQNGFIEEIPSRNQLKRIQTPQAFISSIIKNAHEKAKIDNINSFTDDCGIVLYYNLAKIFILDGDENNIKITHKKDLKQ